MSLLSLIPAENLVLIEKHTSVLHGSTGNLAYFDDREIQSQLDHSGVSRPQQSRNLTDNTSGKNWTKLINQTDPSFIVTLIVPHKRLSKPHILFTTCNLCPAISKLLSNIKLGLIP